MTQVPLANSAIAIVALVVCRSMRVLPSLFDRLADCRQGIGNQNRANHHCAAKTMQWVEAHLE
jgi:hypothetical protein